MKRTNRSGRANGGSSSASICFPRTSRATFTTARSKPSARCGRLPAVCGRRTSMPPKAERWRWHLKVALASAIAGASRLQHHATRAREQRRPLILGYHRVVENFAEVARTEMPSMLISRSMFEQHIDWVGRTFRFVTLDEIGEHMLTGAPFIEPVAAVTFDDGYRDVH